MGCLIGVVLAVTCCGFEPLQGAVQSFLMGRGEGLKLNADPMCPGPAYDGALNEDRGLVFRDVEQEIHLHSREGSEGAFEPTSFAREIQRLVNLVEVTLVDEGAGKSRLESRILSHHHNLVLFCGLAAGWCTDSQGWDYADVMPVGCAGDCPFARDIAYLKFND